MNPAKNDDTKNNDKMNGKNIRSLDNKHICVCKHCLKTITQVKLEGFSLVCPICKKPQEGIAKECKPKL